MNLFDKFLKKLKTDRNTFFTYVLTLLSVYILIDRVVEFILIVCTGVASVYWGPIRYTLAFAVPTFTFLFSMSSKFIKSDEDKLGWFYSFCIALYILFITMIVEWGNKLFWTLFISLPGYKDLVLNFAYLIKPAISSMALALPLTTWNALFDKLYKIIHGKTDLGNEFKDSIFDYDGIDLSNKKPVAGEYANDIFIGTDKDDGHNVVLPELRRFESTLVVGISGAGKTSMIFEPWVCQDISKKFLCRENSKSLAFAALKSGIATLNAPYNNAYINENFSLNMLQPSDNQAKRKIFNAYFNKLILSNSQSKIIYRNLGITYMSPDYETIEKIENVCDNFGLSYNIIDPANSNSIGINPFAFENPNDVATAISTILKGYVTNPIVDTRLMADVYSESKTTQIIENLVVLLKLVYPKLNDGKLPNLEDLLKLLNNFSLIEKMCRILETDKKLSEQYEGLIIFIKNTFYSSNANIDETKKLISIPDSQISTLLRYPGVKSILCNRSNNLNFDKSLQNGDITFVCTRRGDLGENGHKLLGLFFLLLMQYSVLRRPGNENTRIPNFLYIDEFPDFICQATESLFTIYRKYRVATVVSAQNLDQLRANGKGLGDTIIANCSNKIVFGNNSPEDNEWWSKEIGDEKGWHSSRSYDLEKQKYDSKAGGLAYGNSIKYKPGKVQSLKFKKCMYKIRDGKGKLLNGTAKVDFMPAKYKEKQKIKTYDFEKYSNGYFTPDEKRYSIEKLVNNRKNNLANQHFSDNDTNNNPIKMDNSDITFEVNNDDAIVFNLDNKKKKNS